MNNQKIPIEKITMEASIDNFGEIAHDMRLTIEREREKLSERLEQLDMYLKMVDCMDHLQQQNADLQDTIARQAGEIDSLQDQLQRERNKREELEMKHSELSKLSVDMAKKSSQEELIKALRTFVNKSKQKRIEKRMAVKEMVMELAIANNIIFPADLAATLDSLDDEQTETRIVNVQGSYNDIHDNSSVVNSLAEGGQ